MAQQMERPVLETRVAEADLSTSQYYAVKRGAAELGVVLCGLGERPLGVLYNKPADTAVAEVAEEGFVSIVAGEAVAIGAELAIDASGQAITALPGTHAWIVGEAEEAATALGDIIIMKWNPRKADPAASVLAVPVSALSAIANNDFLLNGYVPGFAGKIAKLSFVTGLTPASTAGKDIDLTMLVGATPTTGGLLTLLTADVNAKGKIKDATAITAGNAFTATGNISLKCVEATAAFIEGNGTVLVVLTPA